MVMRPPGLPGASTVISLEAFPPIHFFVTEPLPSLLDVPVCKLLGFVRVSGSFWSGLFSAEPLPVPRVADESLVHVEDQSSFLSTNYFGKSELLV